MVFGTRIVFSILLLGFTTRASTGEDRAKPDANQEGQTPVKKEAAAEAPPPPPGPMPDLFGGPIDKRPKLTGNWDDVRNKMAMKGVIADIDLTAVFQHQAAGGSHSDSLLRIGPGRNEDDAEFMGLGEISLIFDMNRTGLWK
ncbi:MAG: hypothetical protein HUU41_23345, partial [Bryobacteraceae bacterium]|nr:hypothetical protein [Bryobacteraceae bacterium]